MILVMPKQLISSLPCPWTWLKAAPMAVTDMANAFLVAVNVKLDMAEKTVAKVSENNRYF